MAFRDQPLGELALSIPRASALFRKYDMDYCCGGKQTLARAALRKELNVEVIEAELAKLAERTMRLQFSIQDGHVWVTNGRDTVQIEPRTLLGADRV